MGHKQCCFLNELVDNRNYQTLLLVIQVTFKSVYCPWCVSVKCSLTGITIRSLNATLQPTARYPPREAAKMCCLSHRGHSAQSGHSEGCTHPDSLGEACAVASILLEDLYPSSSDYQQGGSLESPLYHQTWPHFGIWSLLSCPVASFPPVLISFDLSTFSHLSRLSFFYPTLHLLSQDICTQHPCTHANFFRQFSLYF